MVTLWFWQRPRSSSGGSSRRGAIAAANFQLSSMFGKGFSSSLRAWAGLRGAPVPRAPTRGGTAHGPRLCSAAAAGSALGPVLGATKAGAAFRLGSAMLGGAGVGVAWAKQQQQQDDNVLPPATSNLPWVQELESKESVQEVLSPSAALRKHPVGAVLVDQDHLVSCTCDHPVGCTNNACTHKQLGHQFGQPRRAAQCAALTA